MPDENLNQSSNEDSNNTFENSTAVSTSKHSNIKIIMSGSQSSILNILPDGAGSFKKNKQTGVSKQKNVSLDSSSFFADKSTPEKSGQEEEKVFEFKASKTQSLAQSQDTKAGSQSNDFGLKSRKYDEYQDENVQDENDPEYNGNNQETGSQESTFSEEQSYNSNFVNTNSGAGNTKAKIKNMHFNYEDEVEEENNAHHHHNSNQNGNENEDESEGDSSAKASESGGEVSGKTEYEEITSQYQHSSHPKQHKHQLSDEMQLSHERSSSPIGGSDVEYLSSKSSPPLYSSISFTKHVDSLFYLFLLNIFLAVKLIFLE